MSLPTIVDTEEASFKCFELSRDATIHMPGAHLPIVNKLDFFLVFAVSRIEKLSLRKSFTHNELITLLYTPTTLKFTPTSTDRTIPFSVYLSFLVSPTAFS